MCKNIICHCVRRWRSRRVRNVVKRKAFSSRGFANGIASLRDASRTLNAERLLELQSQSTDVAIACLRHAPRTFRFSTRRYRERFIRNDDSLS